MNCFENANVIQVLTGEIIEADSTIANEYIAGEGAYSGEKEIGKKLLGFVKVRGISLLCIFLNKRGLSQYDK